MKIFFGLITTLMATTAVSQNFIFDEPILPPNSELVVIEADQIHIAEGFDDNDEVTAVLDGYLPDSCYRVTHNETILDPETGTIKIVQMARRYNSICLPVRVPYFNEANLGVLPTGSFVVTTDGAPAKTLVVAEANNSGPDDFLYAPVDDARVEADFTNNRYIAVLQGRFTNTCMAWKEVKLMPTGGEFVVLPIVQMEDRTDCIEAEIPFSWVLDLPEGMATGRHLLHVRSLNGKAINHMFSVVDPALPPIN